MRVIHLLKHGVQGNGGVHVAVDLACAQADAGHEVYFASARNSYDEVMKAHGVKVVDLPEPTGKRALLLNIWALWKLTRSVKADVLHAHMMSSAVAGFLVAKVTAATLVTTMHNSFDGHSWLMRLGKVTVAVSEAERRAMIARGWRRSKVITVVNGVGGSAREAQPLDDIGPLHQPSLMTMCGLHPRKAVDDVISAFALVADEFPQWQLNVVGWGAERENLQAHAVRLGVGDRVHFLGSTLTPWPLMASTEIFATGSLADPCPLTVMEARVAGRAVIGTAVGGIPETLDHGSAGQLVAVHDPAAMAAALRPLIGDPDVLASWQQRSLTGSSYYTVRRMADDYDRVYEHVTR